MNKVHKRPNVNIEICNAEQKIAYNYLFSWTLNKHDKEYAYECVKFIINFSTIIWIKLTPIYKFHFIALLHVVDNKSLYSFCVGISSVCPFQSVNHSIIRLITS